ncbi:hypothetical protein [Myxosarcina sp. GI1]|uniref:hypothetical protein n=1 Tax=Myxosarcina sp. GI1 TaxID=1541065 RepID=UPI0005621656|nr:hypothetical protein [Myxosarcina sp. GI1]
MKLTGLKKIFQTSVRFIVTAFICGLLVFSSVLPAQAAADSNPRKGEANLNSIQKETDDVAKSNPRNMEETMQKAKEGTNEVQGAADTEEMVQPGETGAESVEDKANNFLQNLTK